MLLVPFVSALVLARRIDWEVLPAAVAVVGVFLIREPLVVLWRQAAVWKDRRPETNAAQRSLAWYGPPVVLAGLILLWRLPTAPLAALGLLAGGLLAISTYLVVHNRRRSVVLQVSSAAGLNASAVVAWLAVHPELDSKIGWLWGLQFAHSAASLLAVHARLEARIASRTCREVDQMRRRALVAQGLLLLGASALAAQNRFVLALALLFSACLHATDVHRLRDPRFLAMPLTRVGLRELAISLVFSVLVLVGLW
jgi:hypothetical protein